MCGISATLGLNRLIYSLRIAALICIFKETVSCDS